MSRCSASLVTIAILAGLASPAWAQVGVHSSQAAAQGVIAHMIEKSTDAMLPQMLENSQRLMEADRNISLIYQILNNKLAAQGKAPLDRQRRLQYFASPEQVVYVPMDDAAQAAADAAFRDQQEAALMQIVNTMQSARWAREAAAKKAAAAVKKSVSAAPPVSNSTPTADTLKR